MTDVLDDVVATEVVCRRRAPTPTRHRTDTAPDPSDPEQMLRDDLLAGRIVIGAYQEIVRWIGDADPTTRRLLEQILAEEEHADDILDLLGA